MNNNIASNLVGVLILTLWTFLYVYSPNLRFLPYSGTLAALFVLSYTLLWRPKEFVRALKVPPLFLFSVLWVSAIIYAGVIESFSMVEGGRSFLNTYPVILARLYIEVFLASICLWVILSRKSRDPENLLVVSFILVVSVQFIAVLIMLLSPSVRDLYFSGISSPVDKLYVGSPWYRVRGYGVAWDYLFTYPLFNGLVFFMSSWLAITRSYWFLVISVVALVPVALNARIGLIFIPIFLLSVIVVFASRFQPRTIMRFSLAVIGGFTTIGLSVYAIFAAGLVPDVVAGWAIAGAYEYIELLHGGEAHTVNLLLEQHLHFPSGLQLVIGDGEYLVGVAGYGGITSDIGYINYLFYGGLMFSLIIYLAFLLIAASAMVRSSSVVSRCLVFGLTVGVFIAHFKGIVFSANPIMKGSFLLLIFIILGNFQGARGRLGWVVREKWVMQ